MPSQRQIPALVGWLAVSFAAAGVGTLASLEAGAFYAKLNRPDWAPPAWLFGPVWTVLYALMGVAAWLVWRQGGWSRQRGPLTLFLIQLAANALWTWIFLRGTKALLPWAKFCFSWYW